MTLAQSDYGYSVGGIGPSVTEVQATHEKTEWAYAVYIMTPGGCAYSQRFEYDADVPGDRQRAKTEALADYKRQAAARPGDNSYSDI